MKYSQIKEVTQKLRHNATKHEVVLWRYLRKRQLEGRKFLRQHVIIYDSIGNEHFFYVSDFYCMAEKLVVELDGKIHDFTKQRDQKRDNILEEMEIKVLRIKNEEVINDIEGVLKKIKYEFNE